MSTYILGISAYYHDSAAALIRDGKIVAAAQEERFTRKKHDFRFPSNAVAYCLEHAEITPAELAYVGFYDRPKTKFRRIVETFAAFAPKGYTSYRRVMPLWLRWKLHTQRDLARAFPGFQGRFVFCDHHESHAASAFFPSPFEDAAVLTIDGVGEWSTTTLGHGRGNSVELLRELRFPHSLGMLYSAFTDYTGFKVNSDEYTVMGLAPYGEPRFADLIREHLIHIRDDGSFWMDMSYFDYCQGTTMTSEKMHRVFGGPPRARDAKLSQRDMDLAASVQAVCEEVMLKCAHHAQQLTGSKNLVMAGGVALNCVGNGRILREGPFDNIWIQPASGDAGGALGVAQIAWHHVHGGERDVRPGDSQHASYLGPAYRDEQIRAFLDSSGAVYEHHPDEGELLERVSSLLADEKVVGWFCGRMEFGPRALGARSIIGDARSEAMQKTMNLKIKFRESFRPFAPSVLREDCPDFFEMDPRHDSPYMLLVAPVKHTKRVEAQQNGDLQGLDLLNQKRSEIPAVTHVDYSARVQTVDPDRHGRYERLIGAFKQRTGCPVIVNTSFNVRGEPIVNSPGDAYRCFMGTHMDVLVLEHFVLLKDAQPESNRQAFEACHSEFELD